MRSKLRIIGLLLAVTTAAAAEMRSWTFQESGKKMLGEVVGFAGEAVSLKLPDGKIVFVRDAYLVESDQSYLAQERANQWKEAEVIKLEGAASIGRYKKCTVRGKVSGEILIQLLPASVEVVLNSLSEQEAQIAYLQSWIGIRNRELRLAAAVDSDANSFDPFFYRYIKQTTFASLEDAKEDLPKLQSVYVDCLEKTRLERTAQLRNTGLVYDGLPVWDWPDPRKPQSTQPLL